MSDQDPRYQNYWWNAEKGKVFSRLFAQVTEIVQRQSAMYTRFVRSEAMYDPNNVAVTNQYMHGDVAAHITENLIASNVDTMGAAIAATEISPAVDTDGADWSKQLTAIELEWYAEQLKRRYGVMNVARLNFTETGKKGTGVAIVVADQWNQPGVHSVLPDDVVVDELETRYGDAPRQYHWRRSNVSKERLKQEFPQFADEIDAAGTSRGRDYLRRGGYLITREFECVEIWSWFLPIGKKGRKGYRPGRFVRCIDGCDLVDEKYEKDRAPISKIAPRPRAGGWFGISVAERIAGHQRAVNKRHWQWDRILDQNASPIRRVRPVDANMAVKTQNELGTIAVVQGEVIPMEVPSPVSPQIVEHLNALSNKASQETGVSQMMSRATKPAGLDSGEALREYHDKTTVRFAPDEQAFEDHVLDILWLLVDLCKDLGADAPEMVRTTRFGTKTIKWSDVDMGEFKIQLKAKASLNSTRAGREQTLIEWAQAGVISTDQFRRLIGHPDLESEISLYTAAMESADDDIEAIANGGHVMPEPFGNLKMMAWRGQQRYLRWKRSGAPEDRLEDLRTYVVTANWMDAQRNAPVMNQNAAPGAQPGAQPGMPPGPPGPGAMPQLPAGPPGVATPSAAFAPTAMQTLAR